MDSDGYFLHQNVLPGARWASESFRRSESKIFPEDTLENPQNQHFLWKKSFHFGGEFFWDAPGIYGYICIYIYMYIYVFTGVCWKDVLETQETKKESKVTVARIDYRKG